MHESYPPTGDGAIGVGKLYCYLDGIAEINFVGHSMGNIVIRHYLGDEAGKKPDGRLRRFVMLGPPNHEAYLASLAAMGLAVLFDYLIFLTLMVTVDLAQIGRAHV